MYCVACPCTLTIWNKTTSRSHRCPRRAGEPSLASCEPNRGRHHNGMRACQPAGGTASKAQQSKQKQSTTSPASRALPNQAECDKKRASTSPGQQIAVKAGTNRTKAGHNEPEQARSRQREHGRPKQVSKLPSEHQLVSPAP